MRRLTVNLGIVLFCCLLTIIVASLAMLVLSNDQSIEKPNVELNTKLLNNERSSKQKCQIDYKSSVNLPLQGANVAIDPGHGGFDPGYFTDEIRECDIVLEIALKLRRLIEQGGGKVIMTRELNTDMLDEDEPWTPREELIQRVEKLSNYNLDILVSIHANSIPSPIWSGAQTFYTQGDDSSQLLAERLQENLRTVLANTDRAALPGDFYILREVPVPSALVEVGFLTNPRERKLLQSEKYQEIMAWALYVGLIDYYNIN